MAVSSTPNLWANIIRRIDDSAAYELLIQDNHLSMPLRSAYNRAITMIDCTIVEALVFYLIRQHAREDNPVISTKEECRSIAPVPSVLGTKDHIFYAKKVNTPVRLSQSQFEPMISYCLKEGLLTESEYKKVDAVRVLRNRTHLHKVISVDRGYTAGQLKKIMNVLNLLVDKI